MKTSLLIVVHEHNQHPRKLVRAGLPSEPVFSGVPTEWVPSRRVGRYLSTPAGRMPCEPHVIPDQVHIGGFYFDVIGETITNHNGDYSLHRMSDEDVKLLASIDHRIEIIVEQLATAKRQLADVLDDISLEAPPATRLDVAPK